MLPNESNPRFLPVVLALVALVSLPVAVRAFTYVASARDAAVIVHPVGYDGQGLGDC
ncbi:MAG: hypothetical protein WD342_04780 [Verrucomicrobiales bacterium]